jgi:putative transposase
MCSNCGNVKHDLKLSDRVYHSDVFGLAMERGLNVAINIRNIGLIKIGHDMPEFTPVESATASEPQKEPYELPLHESGTSNAPAMRGCQIP